MIATTRYSRTTADPIADQMAALFEPAFRVLPNQPQGPSFRARIGEALGNAVDAIDRHIPWLLIPLSFVLSAAFVWVFATQFGYEHLLVGAINDVLDTGSGIASSSEGAPGPVFDCSTVFRGLGEQIGMDGSGAAKTICP